MSGPTLPSGQWRAVKLTVAGIAELIREGTYRACFYAAVYAEREPGDELHVIKTGDTSP